MKLRLFGALAPLLLLWSPLAPALAQSAGPVEVSASDSDAARAWGFADSDVPVDPAVRFGVLPNGMKYALQRNDTPRSVIAMRLLFDVGSLAEAEAERGLAHFLEHMVFNGSTNVPEGEMIRLLERNGLAFGADTNASTGFEATSYRLDLPTNGDALIDTGLMLFAEIGSELTIAPDAVERERGVIQSERRARDNYGLRNQIDQLAFALPGTIVPQRFPIGTEATIAAISSDQLRHFYDRYYRPERATLVIVGDFDVDAMEARIVERFAQWRGRGTPGPDPDLGQPDFTRGIDAAEFVHPAISETVTVSWLKPWSLRADSIAQRQQLLLESIGERILRRRFVRIVREQDSPISAANFAESGSLDLVRSATLSAQTRDGQWRDALRIIEQELRRAVTHGFTEAEVAEQVAGIRTALDNAVASAATRNSSGLAARLLGAADGRSVVTDPATDRAMFAAMADRITPVSVSHAFGAMMASYDRSPLIRLTTKTALDDARATLIAAYRESTRVAVLPPADQSVTAFAYAGERPEGAIIADDRIDDLGIHRVRFANGVMLNIKPTDFEADRVRIQVRIDGGGQLATRDDPTRVALAPLMTLGGLVAHSADELQTILAGRSVGRSFGAAADAFVMGAITTPAELLLQLQLFTATLEHPGYRPEAISTLRRVLPQQYAAMDATPGAVLSRDIGAIIANDDPLTRTPPLDVMQSLDWPAFRATVEDALANGAIEIGIVGALDADAAIAAVARTFGAMAGRRQAFVRDPVAFERQFAQNRTTRTLLHRGERDQAIVQRYWQARDDADLVETVELRLLMDVMQIMLTDELRENLGQTYSPGAGAQLSSDYPGFGYLFASATVAPDDVVSVETAIAAVAAELRDAPVSDDLLDRARRPTVEELTRARRDNGYWLGYVARASSRPDLLDRSRQALAIYAAVTPARIQAAAQRYLRAGEDLGIRVLPNPDVAPAAAPMP